MSLTTPAPITFVAPLSAPVLHSTPSASLTLGSPSFAPSLSQMTSINGMFNPLDVSSVSQLKLKRSLRTKFTETALFNYLVNSIRCSPNFETLKQDVELVLQVYSMIEVITKDSKVQIDKLAMILSVYTAVYAMSDVDKITLVNLVVYMNDSNAFTYKGKSTYKKIYIYLRQLFSQPALPFSG